MYIHQTYITLYAARAWRGAGKGLAAAVRVAQPVISSSRDNHYQASKDFRAAHGFPTSQAEITTPIGHLARSNCISNTSMHQGRERELVAYWTTVGPRLDSARKVTSDEGAGKCQVVTVNRQHQQAREASYELILT